jgi:pimeloyl-ACP methyl ester carboxylesterase
MSPALADSLVLDRFAVLGFSFGGPYARACAYALPGRVTYAGLFPASARLTIGLPDAACRPPHATALPPRDSHLASHDRWSRSPRDWHVAAR